MKRMYISANEFAAAKGITDYYEHYEAIVNALNYDQCVKILLSYINSDGLVEAYRKDKHLNNIYKHSYRKSYVLPRTLQEYNNNYSWVWDDIGYRMLHNPKALIGFKAVSLSTLTSIAKACARMYIEKLIAKELKKGVICTESN